MVPARRRARRQSSSGDRRAWRRSSIPARSDWASQYRRAASAGRASLRPSSRGHIEPACVAHDRIADIDRLAGSWPCTALTSDATAPPAWHRRDSRKGRPPTSPSQARVLQILHQRGELIRIRNDTCRPAMAGMPGQDHGRHRPDRMAERLQREDGGAVADRAARDMARNDDHRARRIRRSTSWSCLRSGLRERRTRARR